MVPRRKIIASLCIGVPEIGEGGRLIFEPLVIDLSFFMVKRLLRLPVEDRAHFG